MIQLIRRHIDRAISKIDFSKNRKSCSSRELSGSKGQVAIILILMTAVALIFYAVTLNLGRLSAAKTMSTLAAEQSASVLASQMASYCQKLVKENLKGRLEVCDKTSLFTAIISFIIIIIIVVIAIILAPYTSGGSLVGGGKLTALFIVMLVAAVALSLASVIMQATIVQPGITDMWNKIIGETMSMKNQFVESGVRAGLEASVSDNGEVADVFDLDNDRVWGFNGDVPRDMVSRFGFYYTERLKTIQTPDDTEIMAFIRNLDDFMHGDCLYYTAECHAVVPAEGRTGIVDEAWGLSDPLYVAANCTTNGGTPNPVCGPVPKPSPGNICCAPDEVEDPLSGATVPIRPECCEIALPAGCGEYASCMNPGDSVSPYSNPAPVIGTQFAWVFDPFIENNYNNAPDAPTLPLGPNPRVCDPLQAGYPGTCCGNNICEVLFAGTPGITDDVWEDHQTNNEGSAGDDPTIDNFAGFQWYCPQDCYKSLREEIGKDDEHARYYKDTSNRSNLVQFPEGLGSIGFRAEDSSGFYKGHAPHDDGQVGVYPLFWRMSEWGWDLNQAFATPSLDYCYWDASAACVAAGVLDHGELQSNRLGSGGLLPMDPPAVTLNFDQTTHVNATMHNTAVATDPPLAADRITLPNPNYIIANAVDCAQEAFDDLVAFPALGFWKQGSDRFCSGGDVVGDTNWPYNANCPKSGAMGVCNCWEFDDVSGSWVACATPTYPCPTCTIPCTRLDPNTGAEVACTEDWMDGNGDPATVPADCACGDPGTLAAANWPEDVLEDFAYAITEFLQAGTEILMKPSQELVNNFDSWYEQLVMWIEPFNDGGSTSPTNRTTTPACYNCEGTAAEPFEGVLWRWASDLEEIRARLLNFSLMPHVAQGGNLCGNAWCVPDTSLCGTFAGVHEEHDKEELTFDSNTNGVTGDIEDVAACLRYNVEDSRDIVRLENANCISTGLPFDENCNGVPKEYLFVNTARGNAEKFLGCINHCDPANCRFLPRSLVPGFDAIAFDAIDDALVLALDNCINTFVPGVPGPAPADPNMSVADCQTVCGGMFPGGTDPYGLNAAPYNVPAWVNPVVNWIPQCNAECSVWCGGADATGFLAAVTAAAADFSQTTITLVQRAQYEICMNSTGGGAIACRTFCSDVAINHPLLSNYGWFAPMSPSIDLPSVVSTGSCAHWWDGVSDAGGPPGFWTAINTAKVTGGGSCTDTTPGGYLDLLNQSYNEALNQVEKFRTRMDFLDNRIAELNHAIGVFETAVDKFNAFLNGPAQDIIQYRINYEDGTDNGLPSAAVYFWQSPPNDPGDIIGTGAWHAVRVDVRTPGRCEGRCNPSQNGPQPWPSIKTETHNWGTKRCFFIINYVGTVKARVSRVDQDQSFVGGMLFPNGVPIWDFRFNHPLRPQTSQFDFTPLGRTCGASVPGAFVCSNGKCESAAEVADAACGWQDCNLVPDCGDGSCGSGENGFNCYDCADNQSCCGDLMVANPGPEGAVPAAYIATFPNMAPSGPEVRKIYSGALILNKPIADGSALDNSRCWLHVNSLLTRGVSSEACAMYFWEGTGFTHRFVNCADW